jgi:hypothetical protein
MPMASMAPATKHKRHKKKGSMASPSPAAT